MFSALKYINCDLKMQFLCNLTSIIRNLNLRTKSPKFTCKFTTIFYSAAHYVTKLKSQRDCSTRKVVYLKGDQF